ncbi:Eukaryotic translation initiation factor 2 subunit gamma [Dictyocoela roeselum]|nr:Eukaryotic translation initiation factor 2 subunit gamma [Dictyocoela roeselum]
MDIKKHFKLNNKNSGNISKSRDSSASQKAKQTHSNMNCTSNLDIGNQGDSLISSTPSSNPEISSTLSSTPDSDQTISADSESSEIDQEELAIMQNQATINIGTIGHVAHGKSTIVKAISGIHTVRFRNELERNITIKLGYANAKIFKCKCVRPKCYRSAGCSEKPRICPKCKNEEVLVRHVSFVDCPGHDILMATMLSGTAIMDMAMLMIAANENVPQPQTTEHLMAVEIMKLDNFVIVQNKIDLVNREQALEQKDKIVKFLKTTKAVDSPIVPVSGQIGANIDALLDYIVQLTKKNVCKKEGPDKVKKMENKDIKNNGLLGRERNMPARMMIIRSFDVNKPGCPLKDLKGGVIGGSLLRGTIKIGDEIEIRPGLVFKNGNTFACRPLITRVTSLQTETNNLDKAYPGGLIGVGTTIDPLFCKADKLVGQVMGIKDLPKIYISLTVKHSIFKMFQIIDAEQVLLNIGSTTSGAVITELSKEVAGFSLYKPACCEIGERIAISKKIKGHWRLVGYGVVENGEAIEPKYGALTEEEKTQLVDWFN